MQHLNSNSSDSIAYANNFTQSAITTLAQGLSIISTWWKNCPLLWACSDPILSTYGFFAISTLIRFSTITAENFWNINLLTNNHSQQNIQVLTSSLIFCLADKDEGLTDEYRYLYQWIAYQCQGKSQCDATEQTLPEWWGMTNTFDDCGDNSKLQYFAGVLIHEECIGMLFFWSVEHWNTKTIIISLNILV